MDPAGRLIVLQLGPKGPASFGRIRPDRPCREDRMTKKPRSATRTLRSRLWFDNPDKRVVPALSLDPPPTSGPPAGELRPANPTTGIARTGPALSPCNRHHLELAQRVREGIRSAGGVAFEFPCHPIQETGKRPT